MRFHIAGVGSIGSLVAYHLRRATPATHPIVLLYDKTKHAAHGPDALRVENSLPFNTTSGFERETYTQNEDPIDSLFVTTRANSALHALHELAPRLTPNSTVVLVHHGLAVYDRIVEELFRNPRQRPHFIFASTTHAPSFQVTGDLAAGYTLTQPWRGNLEFGIVPDPLGRNFETGFADATLHESERAARLSDLANPEDNSYPRYRSLRNTVAALLVADSLNAHWKPMQHLQLGLRQRLAIDSVINPLTALMGSSAVFGAQIREDTKAWIGAGQGQIGGILGIARLPPALEAPALLKQCLRFSKNSKGNISNMLDAVRKGRRTEIEYLNGYLMKLGEAYGVETPTIQTMHELVNMRRTLPVDQIL
ncbi:ketopantoate reductase-like protein [Mycena olivaceomarginata]|nr:ketopantoate reductase-like protein [Mycena olivaceomarginata]